MINGTYKEYDLKNTVDAFRETKRDDLTTSSLTNTHWYLLKIYWLSFTNNLFMLRIVTEYDFN